MQLVFVPTPGSGAPTFEQKRTSIVFPMVACIPLFLMLSAAFAWVISGDDLSGDSRELVACFLLIGALIFGLIPLTLWRKRKESLTLTFDHGASHLKVTATDARGTQQVASLPYGAVTLERSSHQEWYKTSANDRKFVTIHDLGLRRPDGSWWVLSSSPRVEEIESLHQQLQPARMTFSGTHRVHLAPTGRFQVRQEGSLTVVEWDKRPFFLGNAIIMPVLLAAFGRFMQVLTASKDLPFGFMAYFLYALAVLVSLSTLRAQFTRSRLEVGEGQLRARLGRMGANWVQPLSEIESIMFTFMPYQKSNALMVLRPGQKEFLQKLYGGQIEQFSWEIVQQARQMRFLLDENLTLVELLELEKALEVAIRQQSGRALK